MSPPSPQRALLTTRVSSSVSHHVLRPPPPCDLATVTHWSPVLVDSIRLKMPGAGTSTAWLQTPGACREAQEAPGPHAEGEDSPIQEWGASQHLTSPLVPSTVDLTQGAASWSSLRPQQQVCQLELGVCKGLHPTCSAPRSASLAPSCSSSPWERRWGAGLWPGPSIYQLEAQFSRGSRTCGGPWLAYQPRAPCHRGLPAQLFIPAGVRLLSYLHCVQREGRPWTAGPCPSSSHPTLSWPWREGPQGYV